LFSHGVIPKILLDTLREHKNRSKTFLSGDPHTLNQIVRNEALLDELGEHVYGIVNLNDKTYCDSTGCTRRGILFNDQMINWKSGVNFYTCCHNHQHFLPIFVKRDGRFFNLLNFLTLSDDSDIFEIEPQKELCGCGRFRMPFRFVPHFRHSIDVKLQFQTEVRWVQLIQAEALNVYSDIELLTVDKISIESLLGSAIYKAGQFYQLGTSKIPLLWKET
jgi:hypothetical protein